MDSRLTMRRLLGALAAAVALFAGVVTVLATPQGKQVEVSAGGAIQPVDGGVTAYNPQTNQTLVAWEADDPSNGNQDEQDSIFVRLVDASGQTVGPQRRISDPGAPPNFARSLSVAYNGEDNRFVAVWSGGTGTDEDIRFQMLNASGNEVGPNDQPITDGVDNQGSAVVYNAAADRYLVVWDEEGSDQIRGQQLTRAGAETGPNDFQVSNAPNDAESPELADNGNQHLVVWEHQLGNDELEIFGRRVDGNGGTLGPDFRISQQTAEGRSSEPEEADDPDVVHNTSNDQYLVVWKGDRLVSNRPDDLQREGEIFGQRLTAAGRPQGSDFRITRHMAEGDALFDADNPRVAYDPSRREYLIVWSGDLDDTPSQEAGEVFASCVDSGGNVGGSFRLSKHGPEGDERFDVNDPDVAFSSTSREFLAVWRAPATVQVEQIFGRRANCREPSLAQLNAQDPPTLGSDMNVGAVKGKVLVAVPANRAARAAATVPGLKGLNFVPIETARQVPIGSFLDTRKGTAGLTTARDRASKLQSGRFSAGVFQVLQSRKASAKGLTELAMKGSTAGFRNCGGRNASASALSRRAIRRLRARARGRFRTGGRYSAATVRGTTWSVTDRCDGTLTQVKRGKVAVRDFRRKKTIVVTAGKSYLAEAPGG